MRAGALDGLSIGYRTVRGRTDAKTGVRALLEVDLWEISVVTFPMLPEARVTSVKDAGGAPGADDPSGDGAGAAGTSPSASRAVGSEMLTRVPSHGSPLLRRARNRQQEGEACRLNP